MKRCLDDKKNLLMQSSTDTIEMTKEKLHQDNTKLQVNYLYNAPSEDDGRSSGKEGPSVTAVLLNAMT